MKMLLTSGGVRNPSIHDALLDLLGKPIAECHALCITTASYGHPMAGPAAAWRFVAGLNTETPMMEFGWASMGLLEVTALESLGPDHWHPWVRDADVFLVNGGDAPFLSYWMRRSGLADLLPSLDAVWVGLSAGSMVMAPRVGKEFVEWTPPGGGDETLGLVDFAIFPHVNNPDLPWNTFERAETWAAAIGGPAYAIDEETAIKVDGDSVEVVSGGEWRQFPG